MLRRMHVLRVVKTYLPTKTTYMARQPVQTPRASRDMASVRIMYVLHTVHMYVCTRM